MIHIRQSIVKILYIHLIVMLVFDLANFDDQRFYFVHKFRVIDATSTFVCNRRKLNERSIMILLRHTILNNPLLKIHLKVMRICGSAVFDDQRFHCVHQFRGFLVLFIWTEFIFTQFIDLYQVFGDINKMTTNAAFTLLLTIILVQCYEFLYYKSSLITILFNEIDLNMNKIESFIGDSEERRQNIINILANNVRYSNRLTVVYWASGIFSGHMMYILAVWKYLQVAGLGAAERMDVNLLMIRSWYPVDIYEYYIPIYIHQLINCYLALMLVPLIQTIIVVFMIYAIAMLQILKYRCETFTDGIESVRLINDRNRILKQKLRDYVATQLDLRRYVQILDELISPSMFFMFVIFSILLCSLLYQVSTVDFGAEVIIPAIFIINMIVILLTYYWHANEIVVHSSDLPNSLYLCEWHTCSKKLKRLMLIFMIGSQRPLKLSAIYFTMNLDAFLNLLKASYSYFTLLSHISDRG